MTLSLRTLFFTFILALFAGPDTAAAVAVTPPPAATTTAKAPSRADLEARLGRKLNFKERLVLGHVRRQFKRQERRAAVAAKRGRAVQDVPQKNGIAIASLVCGIMAFVLVPLFFPTLVLAPLAIIFGASGLKRANREGAPHKGLAIAGLVLGIIGTVAVLVALLVILLILVSYGV